MSKKVLFSGSFHVCTILGFVLMIGLATPAIAELLGGFSYQEPPPVNACAPSNPLANPEKAGGVMCQQAYALCISAACEPTENIPNGRESDSFSIGAGEASEADIIGYALCSCDVVIGNSMGNAPCDERAQNGEDITSTYSFQQNNRDFRLLTCDPKDFNQPLQWADCYNQPCKVDPQNTDKAICNCPVFPANRAFVTRGGIVNRKTAVNYGRRLRVAILLWQIMPWLVVSGFRSRHQSLLVK